MSASLGALGDFSLKSMGLSLLIYALAEHELREQVQAQEQFIPDQKGKSTQHPTMRRAFQMFEGIHILLIETGAAQKQIILMSKTRIDRLQPYLVARF